MPISQGAANPAYCLATDLIWIPPSLKQNQANVASNHELCHAITMNSSFIKLEQVAYFLRQSKPPALVKYYQPIAETVCEAYHWTLKRILLDEDFIQERLRVSPHSDLLKRFLNLSKAIALRGQNNSKSHIVAIRGLCRFISHIYPLKQNATSIIFDTIENLPLPKSCERVGQICSEMCIQIDHYLDHNPELLDDFQMDHMMEIHGNTIAMISLLICSMHGITKDFKTATFVFPTLLGIVTLWYTTIMTFLTVKQIEEKYLLFLTPIPMYTIRRMTSHEGNCCVEKVAKDIFSICKKYLYLPYANRFVHCFNEVIHQLPTIFKNHFGTLEQFKKRYTCPGCQLYFVIQQTELLWKGIEVISKMPETLQEIYYHISDYYFDCLSEELPPVVQTRYQLPQIPHPLLVDQLLTGHYPPSENSLII